MQNIADGQKRIVTIKRCTIKRSNGSFIGFARKMSHLEPMMLIEGEFTASGRQKLFLGGATLRFTGKGEDSLSYWQDHARNDYLASQDPLNHLVQLQSAYDFRGDDCPDFLRGLFGFIAYDAARRFERLPTVPSKQTTSLPDYEFFLPEIAVLFDEDSTSVVCLSVYGESYTAELMKKTIEMLQSPEEQNSENERQSVENISVSTSFCKEEYMRAVEKAKEYILNGDIFQVVLSLRLEVPFSGCPIASYQSLARLNPSPFQYCFITKEFQVVGASPEPLVIANGKKTVLRPLAGTRRRGHTDFEDRMLEKELRSSEKELAEHRMLVDLARNDLGRVCAIGTVEVDRLMEVEYYSHVMHLVSNVVGELDQKCSVSDLVRSSFPAGTMTGAPKIRAMEIIEELEPVDRGLYSGGVGFLAGDTLSLYITIRSIVIQNGVAFLQAGAGIVFDSDPEQEYQECLSKLRAGLAVLGAEKEVFG
ncbi:anthranilate synthase component I family protein [Brevibacillus ruminantium]|uniref:Anthranilate synthase component I family protein n=1 Tax=Brevibacillus ruminantium TaxID=2950604 RepID=A0ABY4WGZ7_9BACL|nr:anthranilate synthase component I family protein [Brevibacillus ruminantium]USG64609.1 anthranilate synthase component I family protein [Brevibacillus ruminantium]